MDCRSARRCRDVGYARVPGEVRIFSEKFLNRGDVIVNVGLRQALGSRFKLLASMGTGVTNVPQATSFVAYFGIQVLLGAEHKP